MKKNNNKIFITGVAGFIGIHRSRLSGNTTKVFLVRATKERESERERERERDVVQTSVQTVPVL